MMAILNDVCSLITDGSHFSPMDEGVGYPMLSVKDMREDDFDYSSCKHVGRDSFRLLEANGCKPYLNDVVVAKDGSFLKSAFSIKEERDIALLSSIAILRPKTDIVLPDYLCHYLRSDSVYRMVSLNYITGTALKRIILQGLKRLPISLPSLDEQKKRADILNIINRIIIQRKKQLQKLDDLVKARFVEMFGDPEYNDKGWPIKKLNELCSIGSSKRIYQEEQTMEGIPFWRISDLVSKMDTGNVESSLFIPESRYEELKTQGLVPEPGDILVTSRGTLGRCYIVAPNDCFYFQDGMISWLSQYEDVITPLYIQFLFSMPGFRKQIDGMQAGSTVAYLSIAMLKKLDIMLPGRDIQKQFAVFVSQVDKSKLSIQHGLEKLETLKKSLMQQYFG